MMECFEISEKVDNFSIGATVYFMLSGFHPFPGDSFEEVYEKSKDGLFNFIHPFWKHISTDAKDFISNLLDPNPKDRMSLK